MKTELKRKIFDSAASLCNFVNKCNITKENIQSIIENSGIFFLFYWEVKHESHWSSYDRKID